MHCSSQKCLEVLIIGTNVMYNFSVRPLYSTLCKIKSRIPKTNLSIWILLIFITLFHILFNVSKDQNESRKSLGDYSNLVQGENHVIKYDFLVLFRCDSISRCMATFCSLEIVADMIKIAKRIITPLKVKFLHKKTFYVLRLSECPKLWVWLSRDFLSCFGKNADQNYISDWKVLLGLIESNFSDVWITPLWKIPCTTPTGPFLRWSRYI